MIQFFVNKGLVASGLIAKFGIAYWSVTGVAIIAQIIAIALIIRLGRQHFGTHTAVAVPAE